MSDTEKVSIVDLLIQGTTSPYRKRVGTLEIGTWYPVVASWDHTNGLSIDSELSSTGAPFYAVGPISLKCTNRIHSNDVTVVITYKRAKFDYYTTDDRNRDVPNYADNGTSTTTIIIPAYSEKGSIHTSFINDAYGISSVSVSNSMPGDAFQILIAASNNSKILLAVGDQLDRVRDEIDKQFEGRFAHIRECATCGGTGTASTHGGTSTCPICEGLGTFRGRTCYNCDGRSTVCPTCLGSTRDETTALSFYLNEKAKDYKVGRKDSSESDSALIKRILSRQMWISNKDDIKSVASYLSGRDEDQIYITETFGENPIVFLFVPHDGGYNSLFNWSTREKKDLEEWAESIRTVGIILNAVYYESVPNIDTIKFSDYPSEFYYDDTTLAGIGSMIGEAPVGKADNHWQPTAYDFFGTNYKSEPEEDWSTTQTAWAGINSDTDCSDTAIVHRSLVWDQQRIRDFPYHCPYGYMSFYFKVNSGTPIFYVSDAGTIAQEIFTGTDHTDYYTYSYFQYNQNSEEFRVSDWAFMEVEWDWWKDTLYAKMTEKLTTYSAGNYSELNTDMDGYDISSVRFEGSTDGYINAFTLYDTPFKEQQNPGWWHNSD